MSMGLPPASLWLVGDSPIDIATARAAGATSVAVPGGFSSLDLLHAAAPDHLIATLADLPALARST
ncbi:MAG: HAD family hydrolase [Myxococcales bacterium]|nr:MAG: HAD family hydrolase [Myxococcales bacterium]